MIKLIHILPNLGAGGAEFLTTSICKQFSKKQFKALVVTFYNLPESEMSVALAQKQSLLEAGIEVVHLNKCPGFDLRMMPELYKLFKNFKPDIVHTHRYVLRYALFPIILCRVPVRVHTVHNLAQKEVDWIGKVIHCIAFRLGGVVPVSISQEIARTVRALYGQDIYTPVIYNGIPTARFSSLKAKQDIVEGKDLILLHIGRFAPQKNHHLLVEAFAMAVKEYPSMELWLVGDGPLRPMVEKLVEEKRLEKKIVFLGIRDDVPELLAKADVFVLSSDWEGVPLTVLEAMAAGKPVVATAVGGVPELIEDGVTGFLVPPRDPDALAQAILHLAKDRVLRLSMGEAARKQAVERFDIAQTARAYEELYLKLLECK